LVLVLVVLTSRVVSQSRRGHSAKAPLVFGVVPDFSLTKEDGSAISKAMLLGHPWIADFIFTRCGGQCPRMSNTVAALQTDLAWIKGLRFISFSVDPKWDTPEILAKYARSYHADAMRWSFVTGSQEDVYKLCRQGFKLGVDENTPDAPNIAVEPVLHSNRLVLVDTRGNVRGYYDAEDAEALARLKSDLRSL